MNQLANLIKNGETPLTEMSEKIVKQSKELNATLKQDTTIHPSSTDRAAQLRFILHYQRKNQEKLFKKNKFSLPT